MSQSTIHMMMGIEEALILSTALSGFVSMMANEIEGAADESETDREEMLKMFSVQFCAQNMYESITGLLQEGSSNDED